MSSERSILHKVLKGLMFLLLGVLLVLALTGSAGSAPWWSILPPFAAIAIALVFRQVLFALFAGVWMGAWLAGGATLTGIATSFFATATEYIVPSVAVPGHVSILIFSLFIGGMVGIIGANGGTKGIVRAITRLVTNRRRAQVTTTMMGYIVFFDDYANTMVVGSTMRPLTDRLRISRAKLAYLVDSTAAPVAIIAIISTWIGAVIGYISEAASAIDGFGHTSYFVFLNALPYNFYAFLAIIFVAIIALSGRDFGPMRRAELQALRGHDGSRVDDVTDDDDDPDNSPADVGHYNENGNTDVHRDQHQGGASKSDDSSSSAQSGRDQRDRSSHWLNAALPIIGLVGVTLAGLWITGEGTTIQDVIGSSDSYAALVWGSVFSLFLAIALTISQKLISTEKMIKGMFRGMHLMFEGLVILVLAWSLGMVTQDLDTAGFLVSLVQGVLDPYWIPVLIFLLAGFTSFATGSSWGTMGILTPLVLPLTWTLSGAAGLSSPETHLLVYSSVSAVLAGAVWGDHCSPISDTTILSSLACRCDHVSHVNTQLPYALTVGGISIVAIIASTILGIPLWLIYPVSIVAMIAIVYRFGKSTEEAPDPSAEKVSG
ncbi:Na+/H+ antiporter NhaC family protein [Balneolales bacterium ANBcel1]|nr:Na+/H+ antiporter NhaC family protein [Balneolales bacterium ANBcel1]